MEKNIFNIEYRKLFKKKFQYSIDIQYSIDNIRRNKKNYSEKAAQQRAIYLANKFKNQDGMKFYLKTAWNLNDDFIDWLVGYSFTKTNPAKYFVAVASKKMRANAGRQFDTFAPKNC